MSRGAPLGADVFFASRRAPYASICFSRMRKVATPRLLDLRCATQAWASAVVSTTM